MSDANPFAKRDAAPYALPRDLLDDLQTPALVVYLDRVRENVQRMIDYAGSADRWRPHLKTTKIPEVWAELLAAGVRQFKCATTREAAVMLQVAAAAAANAPDERVDLASRPEHRQQLERRALQQHAARQPRLREAAPRRRQRERGGRQAVCVQHQRLVGRGVVCRQRAGQQDADARQRLARRWPAEAVHPLEASGSIRFH